MHGYVNNGFKPASGGTGNPIIERNHNTSNSFATGYVGNGFATNEIQSNGIKTVPVVERDKSKKEVYAGNGFDLNNNQSSITGGNINARPSSQGAGYVGNGFGEKKF